MIQRLASASLVPTVDAVVIGAGVAGLAAAASLRRQGYTVRVLEAGHRIGGRAWTDHPPVLGGAMFDHGAQWLHSAEHNPLVPLVQAHGEQVGPDTPWEDRLVIADRPGGPPHETYEASDQSWHKAVTAELDKPDMSLADAAHAVADDPWTATIEFWEGAIIAAADADLLSLHDWFDNELEGQNFIPKDGLGKLLSRVLGKLAGPVDLNTRVHAIEAKPGGVRVSSSDGDIEARCAIVTVSTGVLAAGRICFIPALPAETQAAIEGLPMGLLTKIALRAASHDRLGVKPNSSVFRPLPHRGAPGLSASFWPDENDIVTGFIGGRTAWSFADSPHDAAAFMLEELTSIFGTRAQTAFRAEGLMTEWGTDPDFLGAYAYAPPGKAELRKILARPVWDNRLVFAGEATAPKGFAGTVAGAFMSGEAAVRPGALPLDPTKGKPLESY